MVDNIAVVDQGAASSRGVNISRPIIANSNIYNVEVTTKFKDAAAKLRPGTLIKDDHFTLFESVGALEIGDPKMDSGCDVTDNDPDLDFDVARSLDSAEILWMMDKLFCHEVAWQMGYPLSQTLFTSYHIDSLLWPEPTELCDAQFGGQSATSNADPLLHKVFRAYCLALIKCCDLTLSMVTSQHYYEEEDFATQLFNRDLLRKYTVESVLDIIAEATAWLSTSTVEAVVRDALLEHMNFRSNILHAFKSHASSPPAPWTVRAPTLDSLRFDTAQRQPVQNAFSPKIQRRLASSVPPRPMIDIEFEKAIQFWIDTCRHMTDAFVVRAAQCSTDLLTSYLHFNAQDPQPSTYVRSLLQSFLSEQGRVVGRYPTLEFIWNDFQDWTLTSSPLFYIILDDSHQTSSTYKLALQHCKDFITRIERSYINVYRTLCLNRSRCRRTLHHALLEWDQIQAEAEELDEEIQRLIGETAQRYGDDGSLAFSYPLSSWVYHFKLTQLRLLIQTGFELSVYAPHELSGMYWYLTHICSIHVGHLNRISHFVELTKRNIPASIQATALESRFHKQCTITTDILWRQFRLLKTTEELAKSLHLCYAVVARHDLKLKPQVTYSSDELRYEIRMRPFLHLSIPEPLSLTKFKRLSEISGHNDNRLLESAAHYSASAKRALEQISKSEWYSYPLVEDTQCDLIVLAKLWQTDIKAWIRASIAASVAISRMQQKLKIGMGDLNDSRISIVLPIHGDRDYWHPFWAAPRVE